MNKKVIILLLIVVIVGVILFLFTNNTTKSENVISNISNMYKTENTNKIENDIMENNNNIERNENMKLYIKVNNRTLTATLNNNSSVEALLKKLENGSITIDMEDYSRMEKVGLLGFDLPRNDESINTEAGDLILYQGNSFVIYYDNNSWSLTKIGKIDNISQAELKEILGTENVTVTLSIEE